MIRVIDSYTCTTEDVEAGTYAYARLEGDLQAPLSDFPVQVRYNGDIYDLSTAWATWTYSNNNTHITAEIHHNSNMRFDDGDEIELVQQYSYTIVTFNDNGGSGGQGTLYCDIRDTQSTESDFYVTVPTRPNYTFDGYWDGLTNSILVWDADGHPDGGQYWEQAVDLMWDYDDPTLTVWAHWQPNGTITENMSFSIGGGDDLDIHSDNYSLQQTPVSGTTITLSYTSNWTGNHTITFTVGTSVTEQTIGDGITLSYDGNKTFTGTWQIPDISTLQAGGEEIDFTSAVYTPTAAPTQYTLDLRVGTNGDTNSTVGGTVSGSGTYTSGSSVTATATPNSGYKFIEWGYGGSISATNPYTFNITNNTILYGMFESSAVLTFDNSGLSAGTVPAARTITYSEQVTLVNATPPTGYTFKGWATTLAKAQAGTVDVSTNYKSANVIPTSATLYAVWQSTLSYSNNGHSITVPGNETWYYNTTSTAGSPGSTSVTEGGYIYTFTGWNTSANGSGTSYSPGSSVKSAGYKWDTILYAQWSQTAKQYTVNFNQQGGTGPLTTITTTYKSSDWNDITSSRPTRTGYTFAGYYDAQTGGNRIWHSDGQCDSGSGGFLVFESHGTYWEMKSDPPLGTNKRLTWYYTGDTNPIIAYAHWNENSYTITYDDDNGNITTQSVPYSQAGVAAAPPASDDRYDTLGWADTLERARNGIVDYHTGDVIKPANTEVSKTVYCVWRSTLTYRHNNGGSDASEYMYYTPANTAISAPTSIGYNFVSWNTSPNGSGTNYSPGDTVKAANAWQPHLILYGNWSPKNYTLTLNKYDSVEQLTVTYNASTNYSVPTPSYRVDFTFLGYYDENDVQVYDARGKGINGTGYWLFQQQWHWIYDGDLTLYARWKDTRIPWIYDQYKRKIEYQGNSKEIIWEDSIPEDVIED